MPSFRFSEAEYFSTAAGTTFTPDSILNHVADDWLVYLVGLDGSSASAITASAGWTVVDSGGVDDTIRSCVVYKKATGTNSESAPTFTSSAAGSNWSATLCVYRGLDTTNCMDATPTVTRYATSLDYTTPAITTVTNNSIVVNFVALDVNNVADRVYISPSLLRPIKASIPSGFVQLSGDRVQATAGAVSQIVFESDDATQGGQVWSIALKSADAACATMRPAGGMTLIRKFSARDSLTYSAPSTFAATVLGITMHSAAATGSNSAVSTTNWGRSTQLTDSAAATANRWEGGVFTISSTDFSTAPFTITYQLNSTGTARTGIYGAVIGLKSSAGNWAVYRFRPRSATTALVSYQHVIDASTATPLDSAGTVDLTAITSVFIGHHRPAASNTTATVIAVANFALLPKMSLIGGTSAVPLRIEQLADATQLFYQPIAQFTKEGTQMTIRQSLEIGDNSIDTYCAAESSSIQFPVSYDESAGNYLWNVGASRVGVTAKTTATGELDFSATQLKAYNRQLFTIDASAANPGLVTSGAALINFAPTWKTGFDVSGTTFSGCGEVDAKGAVLTSCVFTGCTNTSGAAAKLDTGGGLVSCSFTKSAETYAVRIPAAGTYDLSDTTFSGYTTVINVTAASSTVTITLATGQAEPTYTTAGATVVFVKPDQSFVNTLAADGARYQLSHQQIFTVASAGINTGTDAITLGTDSNGDAASFDTSTAGAYTIVTLTLADGATIPTTSPQIVDGGRYRVKTEASGVITISVTEGGSTINFTTAGTNNGSGQLFAITAETSLARGVCSGGTGISEVILLSDGARVRRKAIHYSEATGQTVTSTYFDDIFIWSDTAGASDGAEIDNAVNPWAVVNQIADVSSITLSEPVENINGTVFTTLTPADEGSAVTGLTLLLEGTGYLQMNAADADGLVVAQDVALWLAYQCSLEAGLWITDSDTLTVQDLYNASIPGLEIDETSGTFTKIVGMYLSGARVASTTTGSVALNVATRGNGSVVGTTFDPSVDEVNANIVKVNYIPVDGTGADSDTWGPA